MTETQLSLLPSLDVLGLSSSGTRGCAQLASPALLSTVCLSIHVCSPLLSVGSGRAPSWGQLRAHVIPAQRPKGQERPPSARVYSCGHRRSSVYWSQGYAEPWTSHHGWRSEFNDCQQQEPHGEKEVWFPQRREVSAVNEKGREGPLAELHLPGVTSWQREGQGPGLETVPSA